MVTGQENLLNFNKFRQLKDDGKLDDPAYRNLVLDTFNALVSDIHNGSAGLNGRESLTYCNGNWPIVYMGKLLPIVKKYSAHDNAQLRTLRTGAYLYETLARGFDVDKYKQFFSEDLGEIRPDYNT